MIGLKNFKFDDQTKRVSDAAEKATFRNVRHAAAAIRRDASESITQADGPSAPGSPPHTHTGGVTKKGKTRKGNLQRAIAYDADAISAVIGPRESVVGLAGQAHEMGESFHGQDYDERPFMGPALEKNLDRFASSWQGSIGG